MSKPSEPIDLERLPSEVRAAFEAMQEQVSAFKEANARLEHLIKELQHALYGKKSEKLA
ncbi:MAG: hypothetical protein GXP03_01980 [Alphaproteobacteria bacterium]|nr:hypothetical protein [Alphaproteobacteria bacterium]